MTCRILGNAIITDSGIYKAGDMPPSGYLEWNAWAEAQHKGGLRQTECKRCFKWRYAQELSRPSLCLKCDTNPTTSKEHLCAF